MGAIPCPKEADALNPGPRLQVREAEAGTRGPGIRGMNVEIGNYFHYIVCIIDLNL